MVHPIETLMNEHRIIERGLDSLDRLCAGLAPDDPKSRARLGELVRFFREYADRVHHAKEEDRLFIAMADHGFSPESGPVYVMLTEHETGRFHVSKLAEIAADAGPLTSEEVDRVRKHGSEFSLLLRGHIQKEDNILFPMASQALPPHVVSELRVSFDDFDQNTEMDALHALVEDPTGSD